MAESPVGLAGLAALGGALGLAVAVGGFVAVRAIVSDPSTPGAAAPVPQAAVGVEAMMSAPGTDELRKLGCGRAMVMDMRRILGDAAAIREDEPRYIVTCEVSAGAIPSCDKVAGIYFAAAGAAADGNTNVRVGRADIGRPMCSRLYAPSGADLGQYPRK